MPPRRPPRPRCRTRSWNRSGRGSGGRPPSSTRLLDAGFSERAPMLPLGRGDHRADARTPAAHPRPRQPLPVPDPPPARRRLDGEPGLPLVELRDGYKPQPDLFRTQGPPSAARVRAPGPAVVALLVEVSNISYPKDSVPFLRDYASAGVAAILDRQHPRPPGRGLPRPVRAGGRGTLVRPPGRLRPRARSPWNWSVTACSPASGVSPWTTSSAILEPRAGTTGGQDVVLPEVRGDPTVPVGGRSRPRGPRSSSARPRKNQALPVPERHGRRPGARPGRRKPDDVPVAASEWPQIIKVLIET